MKKEERIRVQKALADRGLASRREAEAWIAEGRVTVNGEPAGLGDKCAPGIDRIAVDGKTVPYKAPSALTLAIHKPRGIVCTNQDPQGGKTVFDLLPPELHRQRLFCVGRLDKESEGLLLLTNDGELRQRVSHPSHQVRKIYEVRLDKPLDPGDIPRLRSGIVWEGERLCLEKVFPFTRQENEDWRHLEVTLQHGRKRELRRLFYALKYDVRRLRRTQIGGLPLKGIPRGTFRLLSKRELRMLFENPGTANRTRRGRSLSD